MVLYRDQWPVYFILYFAELHIGSSIRYENTLFKKYFFFKCYIVKRNLISFICFFLSIYSFVTASFLSDSVEYHTDVVYRSLKGFRSNDRLLIHVIVSRMEVSCVIVWVVHLYRKMIHEL